MKKQKKKIEASKKIKKKTKNTKDKYKNAISKKISFRELIDKYPESVEVLFANGMHCFGCAMSAYETLEQGALGHGINPDKLVNEINKRIKKNDK